MKILLDECITKKLKSHLSNHNVFTVTEMRWNGLKNGMLMSKCVENNFDILLSVDKNLLYQQNIGKYELTIAVLDVPDSKIETLLLFLPSFEQQVNLLERKKSYMISQ